MVVASTAARAEDRAAFVDVEAGAAVVGRHLAYQDDVAHQMNGYDLSAAPGVYGRAAFYPGALLRGRVASMFGVTAEALYVAAPDSLGVDGQAVPVRAWTYGAGLRVRLPASLPDVGLDVGYVAQRFTLGRSTPGLDAGVPNVGTQSLRIGASARIAVTARVAFTARAAYLAVLSVGDAPRIYFPRLTTAAADFAAGVAVAVAGGVELRFGAEYRRYFSDMHPAAGDARAVSGAVDQYVTGLLGVAWRR